MEQRLEQRLDQRLDQQLAWNQFAWRCGADDYSFEYEQGGLHATLRVAGQRQITLPVVAWEALLDAVKSGRTARARSQANLPPRAGSRWTDREEGELGAAFNSGASIAQLARQHGRTKVAVENQLAKLGLIDRRHGNARLSGGGRDTEFPRPEPELSQEPGHFAPPQGDAVSHAP